MIYLAFPGMGKTPLSKKNGKYFDLDFGFYRTALDVKKSDESELLPSFAKLAKQYENSGFIVLTNEPKIMDFARVSKVFLPTNPKFSAKKMNVTINTINEWIEGWKLAAKKHNVPVIQISVGLDHYLK